MVLNRQDHFLHRQIEFLCRRLDDANVRLMRDEPVELLLGNTCSFERFGRDVAQSIDRDFEDLAAFHHDRRFVRAGLV